MTTPGSEPGVSKTEARFFLVYAALFTPYAVVTPYLQQLLHLYGFSHEQIGYIQGAVEMMAVLAPPFWGILSDKCRCPRMILASSILLSIPALMLLGPGQGTISALAIALLFGFFNKPSIPLTDGLTFAHFRINGADYGHVRIGGTVGFIVAIIIFEKIFHISDDKTGGLIMAVLTGALLFQAGSLIVVPKLKVQQGSGTEKSEPVPWAKILKPSFLAFVATAFMARFSMMSYYSFFSRYLNEVYDFKSVGFIWLIGSISEFPVVFWSKRIMAKIGVKAFFTLAMLGTILRLLGFAVKSELWVVMALQTLHALTFGAYHCSTVTYISKTFPAKSQGSAQTIYSAFTVGLGGLLGSSAGGIVLQRFGYTAMYMSFSSIALAAFIISFFLKLDRNGAEEQKNPE